MRKLFILSLGVILLSVSACVTINIYFPAAAAEKAADRIIDEVWQLQGSKKAAGTPLTDSEQEKPQ